ncbi:MAG: M48 family metallopeptidase [Alphaproteobacteria bacterium]|nr:M48 family metallopeptidase [Alphaproteobacteria bacterium]
MPDNRTIELGGREVALVVRRSARARRLSLRIPGHDDSVELVLPTRAPESDGLDFVKSRAGWILERLDRLPQRIPFVHGAELPLGGELHTLLLFPGMRAPVLVEHGQIFVSGRPEHMARRVGDWLRAEAKRRIAPLAHEKATIIGARVTRITIRDQKSRWGSCATGGRLSFSWRLVLAPPSVLDYVVAHEVAHIAEANHSPAFWRTVDRLTADRRAGRTWLRGNGLQLHRYG